MKTFDLHSPNESIRMSFTLEEGRLFYQVAKTGTIVIERSRIGLVTEDCDFTRGLVFLRESRGIIDESYEIPAFKKAVCNNHAHELELFFAKDGHEMLVRARAYDDGAAYQICLSGSSVREDGERLPAPVDQPRHALHVIDEAGEYHIPAGAANVYAQKYLFSYEDAYLPVPLTEMYQNPYAFPMLIELGGDTWALYAESHVYGQTYGGSHLASKKAAPRVLKIMKAPEKVGPISVQLPFSTPWRAVIAGSLGDIVCSQLLENLHPAPAHDFSYVQGGPCAWNWIANNASGSQPQQIKTDIDFASAMGFPYVLIDAGWPGHVDIPAMVAYGRERGVRLWIWEHSAEMDDPAMAEEKMRLWSAWGVAGLKIDFFESDSQERMARHAMLAETAARYALMLNFHGCAKPTGTSRLWPHVLAYEGVLGGEYWQNYSTFRPGGPDAAHNCTLPFTRNAMGPMDYTPLMFESFATGTSDTHQVALTVIFTSYLQCLAEKAELILRHPCAPFLKKLRATWDETLLLEGAPASHVSMARRSGGEWFVAGICAGRPRMASLSLDFLDDGQRYKARIFADDIAADLPFDHANGALPALSAAACAELDVVYMKPSLHKHDMHAVKVWETTVEKGDTLEIALCVNGGFVMCLEPLV